MPRTPNASVNDAADASLDHPLSAEQQRVVFLEELAPDTPHQLVVARVALQGELHPEQLENCLARLADCLPELRLALKRDGDSIRQYLRSGASYEFELHDLSGESVAAQEASITQIIHDRALRPMAVEHGPYFRFVLMRLRPDAWELCFTAHRIFGDEVRLAQTYRALVALYGGRAERGSDHHVFASLNSEQAYLASPEAAVAAAFWRDYLVGAPSALDLTTDRPRPAVQHMETRRVRLRPSIDGAASRALASGSSDVPDCLPHVAALAILLYRYTRQPEIVLGLILRRSGSVITLPLRISLVPLTPFRDLVLQIKRQYDRCVEHAALPFDRLVEAVDPERSLARAPIFQAAVEWRDDVIDPVTVGGVAFVPQFVETGWSELDIALVVWPAQEGVDGYLEANAGLFDPATGTRMAQHLHGVLRSAVDAPEMPLGALPMLTPEEREQLLVTWNAATLTYPRNACIHQLIAREALRYPGHVALIWKDQRVTYGELDRRANQLAHFLQALHVGPEVFVGVCMERRPDLLIALLAVMKAGAAYVPLDPRYPSDRIAFMLEDTRAPVVLTDAAIAPSLPAGDREVVAVDALWESISAMPDTAPEPAVEPDNLAYVIYTSGSTGIPKGVAISHRPAVALFYWARSVFTDADLRGMLASTSICFDLSVFELFFPLAFGGRIVLVGNVLELLDFPEASSVTLINTVPSAMNELVRLDGVPQSVTTVCLAGEPLPPALAAAIYRLPHVTHLYNLYGPSEDTTYSTWVCVPRGPEPLVTIGRPISNTQAYVLDPDQQPVPVGVPGELYLAGDGLARGYHNRPELTAERFVDVAFGHGPAIRMYRTGDLVKYLANGELYYLGRMDHQVKIRGFRIELGEIQTALERHDGVREAAVVVREDAPGDKRIIAYVAVTHRRCTTDHLRRHLAAFLPPYMIPSAIVMLEALPRTPNGKLDRKALPAPVQSDVSEVDEAFTSSVERSVAALWRDVLSIPSVSRRDNFFALGGHSLIATQLTARVRDAFGIAVPLRTLFERPFLDKYAQAVSELLEAGAADGGGAIPALPYTGPEPLSYAQEGLWFLEQYQPGLAAYTIPAAFRLRGTVDVHHLEAAINATVQCHEALRTALVEQEGTPLQCITPDVRVRLKVIELHDVAPERRERVAWERATAIAAEPFDLAQAPLMRAVLIRLFHDDSVLFLPHHHIVSDGWSLHILSGALAEAYRRACDNQPVALPKPKYQYRDFARWQHALLDDATVERLVGYWRNRLAGAPPYLDLATDHPRPPRPTFTGGREPIDLSDALARDLSAWCRDEKTTLYTVFLATVFALMYRYTAQRDIVLGAAVAHRERPEWKDVFGYFVNALPIRESLEWNDTFRTLVQRLHTHLVDDREHQDLPFERMVDAVLPERDAVRHPLFQVMVVLQNTPPPAVSAGGIAFQAEEWANGTSKFDLTFSLNDRPDALGGYLEYDDALFRPATMRRMVGHLRQLLHAALHNPDTPVSSLMMMTDDERRQLQTWSVTTAEYPRDAAIHTIVEARALEIPNAVAVSCGEQRWTYRTVNDSANRIAHRLMEAGVRPGDAVALCAERSPQLVAAILGILKAGAGYVPIDPAYPKERIRHIAEDAGAPLVLCDAASRGALPDALHPIALEDAIAFQNEAPVPNPGIPVAATDLAYIMYTSGSTGTPKGVRVPHRAVLRLVCNTNYISIAADDTFLLMAPIAFDASTFEIWGALLNGARLAIMPPGPLSLGELRAQIRREHVTVVWLTAGLFHLVVEEDLDALRPLRWLLAGGDVLRPDAVRRCLEAHPHCTLINGYGPTENTTFTTCFPMTAPEQVGDNVAIGWPVANTSVYILDEHMQLVAPGLPGELYTGGDGLALGYHGRPDLSAERFVPNPFSTDAHERLYRTGDRARYRDDGAIEFMGRIDTQVKIRGFRIELEEIECVLAQHPAVRAAAVVAPVTGATGDRQLIAFVVLESSMVTEGALQDYLRERLPEFMVPPTMHVLDVLPLSANGKVDRAALSGVAVTAARGSEASEAPHGALESDIAELWTSLLQIDRVGRHDNFFTLGGHSLLATQVAARLSGRFGVHVPVRAVFENPTIEALARVIAAFEEHEDIEAATPITPVPRTGSYRLSFSQRRLWFLDQLVGGSAAYVIPAVLELEGPFDLAALQRAIDALVQRHEVLRATFHHDGDEAEMRIAEHMDTSIRITDVRHSADARTRLAQRIFESEAATPFSLTRGPLIRFHVAITAPHHHYLMISTHHIISDGWSQQIVMRELAALYEGQLHHQVPSLPEPELQYADYASWQYTRFQGAPFHRRLAYWRTHIAGAPMVLELPHDFPRPPVLHMTGHRHNITIAPPIVDALHDYCRARGVTPYVVLLAAFYALLRRLSGRNDLIVGSVMANRPRLELQGMVGFFANTLALRPQCPPDASFDSFVDAVHDTVLAAHDYQDLPLDALVEAAHPRRDRAYSPLIQVVFSLNRVDDSVRQFGACNATPIDVDNGTSKFDLSLQLEERAGSIHGFFEYSSALFAPATVARWSEWYERLLECALVNAHAPIVTVAVDRAAPVPVPVDLDAVAPWLLPYCNERRSAASADRGSMVLTPAQAAQALTQGTLPRDVQGIGLAGDWIAPSLVRKIFDHSPVPQIVAIFELEEVPAAMVAVVDRHEPVSKLAYRPVEGVFVEVCDPAGNPQLTGVPGELIVGGANRRIATGDLARRMDDASIQVLGRMAEVIDVGGALVYLRDVEQVLLSHAEVLEARVLIGDAGMLTAYLTMREGASMDQLRDFVRERIPELALPVRYAVVPSMPLTARGRYDLDALAAMPVVDARTNESQVSEVEDALRAMWREVLQVHDIGRHDNFFDLGGHSLLATQLLARLRKELQMSVSLDDIYANPTIADLTRVAVKPQPTSGGTRRLDPCIVPIKATGSRRPFFCVSGAGGPVYSYFNLAPYLHPEQPFFGLQAPLLEDRAHHFDRIEDLAAYYVRAIREMQPDGPYLVGGWSFGGAVAFEIARQLRDQACDVAFLGLIDAEATVPPRNVAQRLALVTRLVREKLRGRTVMTLHTLPLLWRYACDGVRIFGRRTRGAGEQDLSLRDYVRWVVRDQVSQYFLKQANIAQQETEVSRIELLNDDRVRLITDVFTANETILRRYAFDPYPGEVTLFRATHDPWRRRPLLGWDEVAERVVVHDLEGNHLVIFRAPFVRELGERLDRCLAEAQGYAG